MAVLSELVAGINYYLGRFRAMGGTTDRHRVAIGKLLLQCSEKVPHGEWKRWCMEPGRFSSHLTFREIQRMMAIARSSNPIAAHNAEIAKSKEQREKNRKRNEATSMSHHCDTDDIWLQQMLALWAQGSQDAKARFRALTEEPSNVIQLRSNGNAA